MDKKPILLMSILAVVLLVMGSLSNVVGYQTQNIEKSQFLSMKKTQSSAFDSFNNETELKYYDVECLDIILGFERDIWKSAIRLTQDEMAAYAGWTLTKVNVAFNADEGCSVADVRIYLYDKGTNVHPGPLIANDTLWTIDTTGITTVPLVTSINLSDYEELWIAIEWTPIDTQGIGIYYAWMDQLSGPHVTNKSDFIFLNSWGWTQLHTINPECDGRWGIGAIIEDTRATELTIGYIHGPVGITTKISNIGVRDAENVSWSISVNGGFLHGVVILESGMLSLLDMGSSAGINVGMFFGFGKILIIITAEAKNAPEVLAIKTAILLGRFVFRIR
jgi:hypothetical protein